MFSLNSTLNTNCRKSSPIVPVFKSSGEVSNTLKYQPVSIIPLFRKAIEDIINSEWVTHHTSQCHLTDKQYDLRFSRSAADVLTVNALDRNGESRVVALNRLKVFDRVWFFGLLHKVKRYVISSLILYWIESFSANHEIKIVLNDHSSRSFTLMQMSPRVVLLDLLCSLFSTTIFKMSSVLGLGIYTDGTTIYYCLNGM